MSQQNFLKDQSIFPLIITLFILITLSLTNDNLYMVLAVKFDVGHSWNLKNTKTKWKYEQVQKETKNKTMTRRSIHPKTNYAQRVNSLLVHKNYRWPGKTHKHVYHKTWTNVFISELSSVIVNVPYECFHVLINIHVSQRCSYQGVYWLLPFCTYYVHIPTLSSWNIP